MELENNNKALEGGYLKVGGERHIESFAMTHRESNDDMNSNNLFETL